MHAPMVSHEVPAVGGSETSSVRVALDASRGPRAEAN